MIALLVLSLWVQQQPIEANKDVEKIRSLGEKLIAAGQQGKKADFAAVMDNVNKKLKKQVGRISKEGHPAVMLSMMILDARFDLYNTPDKSGTTPLMFAAAHGWNDLVNALLDGGARRGDMDKDGRSAADYADAAGLINLANSLRGANRPN